MTVQVEAAHREYRYEGIQCLRFVAAALVVATHISFYISGRLDSDFGSWQRGTRGVDIFFVISGFVMYVSSAKLAQQKYGWADFAIRRIIRIVPLYWLVTTFVLLVMFVRPGLTLEGAPDTWRVIASYLFLPTRAEDGRIEPIVGVGWTLTLEMLFYALFSLALLVRANTIKFMSVTLGFIAIIALFKTAAWPTWAFYFHLGVLEFLAGMLIARYLRSVNLPFWVAVAIAVGAFTWLMAIPLFESRSGFFVTNLIPSSLVVWGVVALEPYLSGKWPKPAIFLGAASYSLYLVHPVTAPLAPAAFAALGWQLPWVAATVAAAIAMAASVLAYLCVEQPVSRAMTHALNTLRPVRASDHIDPPGGRPPTSASSTPTTS